jgi:hypothetical protein
MFATVINHYELMSPHFKELPSYSTYAYMGDAAAAAGGPDKAYRDYFSGKMIGTPRYSWSTITSARKWSAITRCSPTSAGSA